MKISNWVNNVKSLTGATSSELTIVTLILSGLIFGMFINYFTNEPKIDNRKNLEIFKLLDSLAEQSKAKYVGTDEFNNPGFDSQIVDSTIVLSNDVVGIENSSSQPNPQIVNKTSKVDKLLGIKLNINTASKVELMKLPGIGEKTAIKIIEFRSKNLFRSISDIKKIKGIGEKKFQAMKDYIEVK
jgi:competence ComEA-like helix-hairpin-helix protein